MWILLFVLHECLQYGTTCHNVAKVFSPTDDAYNEKFIKRYFIMGIFIRNHSKIDKTEEGVEGPAG